MRRSIPLTRFTIVLAASTFAGSPVRAQQKIDVAVQAKPATSPPAAAPGAPALPLSEADCREYAQAVVKAVATGEETAFNALIDWDAIFATATTDLGASENMVAELIKGMRASLVKGAGPTRQLIENSKTGGTFDFLRTRISHGRQVILFRLIGPENQGVNYFEFAAKRGPDQKIRAVDFYVFMNGEFFTESLRRAILPMAASESRTFIDKLLTREQDYVKDFPKLKPIAEAAQQGRAQDALRLFKELRPETKKQKFVLLIRIQAAQAGDEKDYVEVLEEFRRLFPNDPCLDLLSIDYYTLKNDFAQLEKCINRLDASVGGDPYLSYLQAAAAAERGDRAKARRLANLAVNQEPPFKTAYFYLVGLSIEDKNYDATLAGLKKLHETFGTTFKDLTTVPEYAGFVKSPQYKEWLQYLEQQAKRQKPKPDQKPAPGARNRPRARRPRQNQAVEPAGCCWDRQCKVPSPNTRSTLWMPTT